MEKLTPIPLKEEVRIDEQGRKIVSWTIPKEFHWLLQLKRLKEKGFLFEFEYIRNGRWERTNHLKYFELDSEGQSYVPVRPDRIRVLRHVPGKGLVVFRILESRRLDMDPDVDTAMAIWELANEI